MRVISDRAGRRPGAGCNEDGKLFKQVQVRRRYSTACILPAVPYPRKAIVCKILILEREVNETGCRNLPHPVQFVILTEGYAAQGIPSGPTKPLRQAMSPA